MTWEDKARRAAIDGDWHEVARLIARAGYSHRYIDGWDRGRGDIQTGLVVSADGAVMPYQYARTSNYTAMLRAAGILPDDDA